jgi:multidrug efflux system membrane fusion protein
MPAVRAVVAFALLAALGCARPPAAPPPTPPAPVVVTNVVKKTVPLQTRAIGSVKVISTVNVRARVGGELTGVHFTEGDFVKKGQKLFTIDPRPYDAAVKQAEATLAKDKAALLGAELDLKRIERVGSVAAAELDAARTAVAAGKAAVEADAAALNSARIQAGFTTIYSPLDGRTGSLLVTAGNLVSATDLNPLVIINQISPITVAFALPEQQLPTVAAAQRQRGPLTVEADLRGGGSPIAGKLAFLDNAVDPTTGTVQLKAEFENADQALWPGQFVDVVLTVGHRPDAVVVPTAVVQSGPRGQYVYVVKDGVAELRPVVVAFEAGGEAVIDSGLAGDEAVVLEGHLRLAPGAKVEVKGRGPTP